MPQFPHLPCRDVEGICRLSGAAQSPTGLGILCVQVQESHCGAREGQEGSKATPESQAGRQQICAGLTLGGAFMFPVT